MDHICNYCDEQKAAYAWETAGRGWKFLCEECHEDASPIIQSYCEVYIPSRYYPTYNYKTRTIE